MNEEAMRHGGSMAAVIGLGKDELLSIIKSINVECEIANDNTDAQKVISGKSKDVDILIDELKKNNKKAIKLKVSGAFHSKLMFGAAEKMKKELVKVEFRKPKVNFVSNVLAEVDYDSESIRGNLVHQIYKTVRWNESVKLLFSSGVNEVVEIGASSVLNNMIKKSHENVGTYNINDLNSFDKFLSSI
jgi:[acyl-carrier-protein] S-malonyltransferase